MENKYDISATSALTGLSPNLIRAWERRYSAVVPLRSSTNRRLYSESDIEKLRFLKRGTEAGLTISSISRLPLEEIKLLVLGEKFAASERIPDNPESIKQLRDYEFHLGNCFEAIEKIDANMLQLSLGKASIYLKDSEVINQVVVPLVSRVRELSKRGILNKLQENLVVNVSTVFLENLINSISSFENSKKVYVLNFNEPLSTLSLLIVNSLCKINGLICESLDLQNFTDLQTSKEAANGKDVIIISALFKDEAAHLTNRIDILKTYLEDETKFRLVALCAGNLMPNVQNKDITTLDIVDIEKIRVLN